MTNSASSPHTCMYALQCLNIISSNICAHSKPHVQKEKYASHLISQNEQLTSKPQISISPVTITSMGSQRWKALSSPLVPDKKHLIIIINRKSSNYQEKFQLKFQEMHFCHGKPQKWKPTSTEYKLLNTSCVYEWNYIGPKVAVEPRFK